MHLRPLTTKQDLSVDDRLRGEEETRRGGYEETRLRGDEVTKRRGYEETRTAADEG
jgi:hypothetical protein